MNALKHVKVINDADGQDGFQITFTLGKDKLGDYSLLTSGVLDPDNRVVIGVLAGRHPGAAHRRRDLPSPGRAEQRAGVSTLTVSGRDLSVMLDLEEKNAEYKNRPDFLIVNEILASYAQYGIVPRRMPTTDVPIELDRIPRQHETDLRFIRAHGARNGYVFYIEPLTLGVNTAYFGPENRLGVPQPALTAEHGRGDQRQLAELRATTRWRRSARRAVRRADHQDQHPDPAAALAADPAAGGVARAGPAHARCARPRTRIRGRPRPRRWPPRRTPPTRSPARASWTRCATAASCGRGGWSACAGPGSSTTASTTCGG